MKNNCGGRVFDKGPETSRITLTLRPATTAKEPLLFEQKHQLLVSLRLSRHPQTESGPVLGKRAGVHFGKKRRNPGTPSPDPLPWTLFCWTPPKISRFFFPQTLPCSLSFFSSGGSASRPRGFHTTAREPKRAHLRVLALQTPPSFHEKTPRERERKKDTRRHPEREKMSENGSGRVKKKKTEILGSPTLRTPSLQPSHFLQVWASTPLGPHTSGPQRRNPERWNAGMYLTQAPSYDEIEHQMPSFRVDSLVQRVARQRFAICCHLLQSNITGCQNQFLDDIVLYVPNPRRQPRERGPGIAHAAPASTHRKDSPGSPRDQPFPVKEGNSAASSTTAGCPRSASDCHDVHASKGCKAVSHRVHSCSPPGSGTRPRPPPPGGKKKCGWLKGQKDQD